MSKITMDLAQLEAEWTERQRRYAEWYAPIVRVICETSAKRRTDTNYTKDDEYNDMAVVVQQQFKLYNPFVTDRPALEALIEAYSIATDTERAAIGTVCHKFYYICNSLLDYGRKFAECIENADDGDLLRWGLIAVVLEGSRDFRDTGLVFAELAIAAREAGIDIEPISTAVAALANPYFQQNLLDFHVYALTAQHPFGDTPD